MDRELLRIYTDVGEGNANPTFHDIFISEYTYKSQRMGLPQLTATIMYDKCLDRLWTKKEYVTFNGGYFYIRRIPTSSKSNTDKRYKHEITFKSEIEELLGGVYFYDAVPENATSDTTITANKPCTNSTKFDFYGSIIDLCDRINCSLLYRGIGDSILKQKTTLTTLDTPVGDGFCVMIDPYGEYDLDVVKNVNFEDKYLIEAIAEGFNTYEVPYEYRGRKIIFNAVKKTIDHTFEYGYENELLSVKKNATDNKIVNSVTMLGGTDNIPHYYPNETEYGHISISADPTNSVLTNDLIEIVNMTQLLSRLRVDTYIRLHHKSEVEIEGGAISYSNYQYKFDNDNSMHLYPTLGAHIKHEPIITDSQFAQWHMGVWFEVKQRGHFVCEKIKGQMWRQDTAQPSADGTFSLNNVTIDILRKNESADQTELTENVRIEQDGIHFGILEAGNYYVQFNIPILNSIDGRGVTVFAWFSGIEIQPRTIIEESYYWESGGKTYTRIGDLGIKLKADISEQMIGDGFKWIGSSRINFQTNLMPTKYLETLGAERFYNALNAPYIEEYASEHQDAYINPETNAPYYFTNVWDKDAPSEYVYKDEDIVPTIEGVVNGHNQLLGVIADIAFDLNDNDSLKPNIAKSDSENADRDASNYAHSFFYIKLNTFHGERGFDLFKHASQNGPMTIQMRSGNCNGCKFKIQADEFTDENGIKYYKNPVQATYGAATIYGGDYEDKVTDNYQEWQQNTQTHSIWICVQKDIDTFGVIMPNREHNWMPAIGDTFNIINIDLPQVYLRDAEKKLEKAGMNKMWQENVDKFTFEMSISRIFFRENPELFDIIDEYSVIRLIYDGTEYKQYVSEITLNCKDSDALPEIQLTLSDTLAVGESFLSAVASQASSMVTPPISLGGGTSGINYALADLRYINKQTNDRTPHKLASDTAFEVGNFTSGATGALIWVDKISGLSSLEIDYLKVRMKAIFEELEILHVGSIGGKQIITPGGGITISYVEEFDNVYRCYFKAKEGEDKADCRFKSGDMVYCQTFNAKQGINNKVSNRYYWIRVVAVNSDESYVDLSKTDRDTNSSIDILTIVGYEPDIPMAGDTIVQLGSKTDDSRRSAIILSTQDTYAPCVTLYDGINTYSLKDKEVITYGVDKSKNPPEPFFNCYGRMYIGPRSRESFLEFNPTTRTLQFKGVLHAQTKIGDETIESYIQSLFPTTDIEYLKQALAQDTVIAGGLIMTSIISMGVTDESGNRKTWAGMSGIRENDRSIASWWGGEMIDLFNAQNELITPTPQNAASALIRMNGTGYFAKGNIKWNEDGSGSVAGGGIRWTANGSIFLSSGIKIDGQNETLSQIFNYMNAFHEIFTLLNANDEEIPYTDIADAKTVKCSMSFCADGSLTAGNTGTEPPSVITPDPIQINVLKDWAEYGTDTEDYALAASLGYELYQKTNTLNGYFDSTGAAKNAVQLKTTRTLWGQNFNGTQSVSGKLTNVGSIEPSANNTYHLGKYVSDTERVQFLDVYASELRNDANRYMNIRQAYNNNMQLFTNNVARVTIFNEDTAGADGQVVIHKSMLIGRTWHRGSTIWNGDNKEVPTLDVTGSAYVTKRIYLSKTDQDVYVEYDASNDMFFFSKGLYTTGNISALNSSNGLNELTVKTMNVQTVLNIGSRLKITPSTSYQLIEPTRNGVYLQFGGTSYSFSNVLFTSTISATGLITAQSGMKLGTTGVTLEHYSDTKIKVTTNSGVVKYINLSTT